MLEGAPGEGQRAVGGSDRNSPKHRTPALRLSGFGGGRPTLALRWAARYFQLFRGRTCGASGGGRRAEGSGQDGSALSGQSRSRAAQNHGRFGLCFPSAGAARSSSAQQAPVLLVILVRLVPAGEQLAGKCSAGVSLTGSDRFPPLVLRAGDRRGAAAGGGVAVSRSASHQIPLNEISPLERPSPPPGTSQRQAPVLLPARAGTLVGLGCPAAPRASFCKETKRQNGEGFPSRAELRAADVGSSRRGGGGCRSRTAPSPAPPAAATSPLQLAAWLFCLIKLNVSVNFPPGRAALPLPEPEFGYRCQRAPSGLSRARGDALRRPRVATAAGSWLWPWAAGPGEGRGRTSPGPTPATGI